MNRWDDLSPKLDQLAGMSHAIKLLYWDQSVMMPVGGSESRARSLATLEEVAHEMLVDPSIGELLDELEGDESLDDDQNAHLRVLRREYDRSVRIPSRLVAAIARESALGYPVWMEARGKSDFSLFLPNLQRMIDLKKEEADAIGWEEERYDALLDQFEPDMTAREVEQMFTDLVTGLKPLVDAVLADPGDPPEFLSGAYDENSQGEFCQWLVGQIGFDGDRGRLDMSPAHPFTIGIGRGDTRQTARADERNLMEAVYAVLHETGHALYDQGIPDRLVELPAGTVPSLGMHESQSRLWENQVGRSREFTSWMLPHLKERFPNELGGVDPDEFFFGANYPQRTFIRISADELTYNFHIALRFELELAVFRGELDVTDLADAFKDKLEQHLGIRPESDADGVLQDVHWATNLFGYFPTYTLGSMYAAAFFQKAEEDLGGLASDLARGDGSRLVQWLREKVHHQAYLRMPKEVATDILGGPLSSKPLIDYLTEKYGSLYDLSV
jgi:carboxypeptidase Taq